MNSFKQTFEFNWTLSKVLAFMIFIGGIVVSIILRDGQIFYASLYTSSGLMGAKTVMGEWRKRHNDIE